MERAGTTNLRSLERTFGSSFVGYSTPFLNFDNFAFVATAIIRQDTHYTASHGNDNDAGGKGRDGDASGWGTASVQTAWEQTDVVVR